MKNKVNKITVLLEIEGQGLVNYNGSKVPKRFFNDMYDDVKKKLNDNGSFGKENSYYSESVDKEGLKKQTIIAKKVISSNLLRKCICGDENSVNADKLMSNPKLRVAHLSQDNVIIRGFASLGKDTTTLKRKGAITVTNAEQISDTITWLETRTSEGLRDATSLHFKENCGHIKYLSEIIFDIKQLKFISIDDNYDRMSLKDSDVEGFINHINSRYGDDNAKLGNWGTTHLNVIGEQGVVLSNKVAKNIIRETIKKILEIDIKRAGSYARTSALKIAIGYEEEDIDLIIKPKFVSINNMKEYDKLVENLEIGVDFLPIEAPALEKVEKIEKAEKKETKSKK